MKFDYIVIGGGLSGLTAAREILMKIPNANVGIIERKSSLGGWVKSSRDISNSALLEHGPHSIRLRNDKSGINVLRLFDSLGLIGEGDKSLKFSSGLINAPNNPSRFIWYQNKLRKIPDKISDFIFGSDKYIFYPLIFSGIKEFFTNIKINKDIDIDNTDQSIHEYFNTRFGSFVSDVMINAMISGIFAGDSKKLSINSCFPIIREIEKRGYGSVVCGMFIPDSNKYKDRKNNMSLLSKNAQAVINESNTISFVDGMKTLTDALEQDIIKRGGKILTNIDVESLHVTNIKNDFSKIFSRNLKQEIHTKHIISAIQLQHLQKIFSKPENLELNDLFSSLNILANGVEYVDVAVVNVLFKSNGENKSNYYQRKSNKEFGYLVPLNNNTLYSKSSMRPNFENSTLGIIYDSDVFPSQQKNKDIYAITVMMGGAHAPWISQFNSNEINNFAIETIKNQANRFNIEDICHIESHLHKNCIPQYLVGHSLRVKNFKEILYNSKANISIIGNSINGVGILDSISSSIDLVEELVINDKKTQ